MFEIVLFPIDRSRQAAETASFALKLAQQHDSRLVVLSVVEPGEAARPALEAAILLMVIGTTFLAPILLRLVLAGKSDGPDLDPLAEIPT